MLFLLQRIKVSWLVVKQSSLMLKTFLTGTIATDPQGYSSNITSQGNFDALNASNQLEITRALLYNYLLSIDMPVISDMILIKGNFSV